jgi:hypothetical protein
MFENELNLIDLSKVTHIYKWKHEGNPNITIYFTAGEPIHMVTEEAERFVKEYREYLNFFGQVSNEMKQVFTVKSDLI